MSTIANRVFEIANTLTSLNIHRAKESLTAIATELEAASDTESLCRQQERDNWLKAEAQYQAQIAELEARQVPDGWVAVPREPTQAMCQEGQWKAKEWPTFPLRISPIYQAMIAAAPSNPTEGA